MKAKRTGHRTRLTSASSGVGLLSVLLLVAPVSESQAADSGHWMTGAPAADGENRSGRGRGGWTDLRGRRL